MQIGAATLYFGSCQHYVVVALRVGIWVVYSDGVRVRGTLGITSIASVN